MVGGYGGKRMLGGRGAGRWVLGIGDWTSSRVVDLG